MEKITQLVIISTLMCGVWGYNCNNCICTSWSGVLSCYGVGVNKLPNITDTEWVRHIDVLHTDIRDIGDLTQWENLQTIDIRDNENLNCDDVLKLQHDNTHLMLTTDCDDGEEELEYNIPSYETRNTHKTLMILACIGHIVLIPPLLYMCMLLLKMKSDTEKRNIMINEPTD